MDTRAKVAAALMLAGSSMLSGGQPASGQVSQPAARSGQVQLSQRRADAAATGIALAISSGQSLTTLQESGEWTVSVGDGQCNASKPLPPPAIGQFGIGLTREGTYLHLQNLRWTLPMTATNTMPIEISFDGSAALRTDALLIGMAKAFQIFVYLSDMPDDAFWKRYLAARSMRVTGPFRPGYVDVDLSDSSQMLSPLRNCVERYLPGVKTSF